MVSEKDLKIISHLRQNARMPLTKMSRKTGIPVSTIFDRLKINEKELITKHVTLIDFSKLGYNTRATIIVRVHRDDKDALKEHLIKDMSVNSVYRINNGYDYMIEGVFRHVKDMEDFLDRLEIRFRIEEKKAHYIIEDLKKEGFMSNPNLL